jgi:hypothetical protein
MEEFEICARDMRKKITLQLLYLLHTTHVEVKHSTQNYL